MNPELLSVSKPKAVKAFNTASKETKNVLADLFGENALVTSVMDRIKTVEDAFEATGNKMVTLEMFSFLPEEFAEYHFYHHQAVIITEALNEGRKPNYDSDERKYENWVNMRSKAAGGPGFSYSGYVCDVSSSCVGARLVFFDPKIGKYAINQFPHIFERFMTIPKS